MFDRFKQGVRNMLRSFLQIQEAQPNNFTIQELLNYESNAFKNKIWYRGDSYELDQLYKQIQNTNCSFWGSVPTVGMEVRKIHTGLPKIIVNTLSSIVLSDLNNIEFEDVAKNDLWEDIVKENKLYKQLEKATKKALVVGDGAFKISFDPQVSQLPIIEFYSGENIDINYDRGRIKEIVFHVQYTVNRTVYVLHETYGFGYVMYKLYKGNSEVPLNSIPQTTNLVDITFDNSFCMAIPYIIFESDRWEGRGQSIFDGKIDSFDSLDEAWSQWVDALRVGRAKTYVPECLLPRDYTTGEVLKPNYFDNRYIKTDSPLSENANYKIDTEQPVIPTENYIQTYITALDLCLQGLISPSTLGIDTKKLDNAEAQREKEKTTLYTRSAIIEAISEMLPRLIDVTFKAYNTWLKQAIEDTEIDVSFGEYANPSFEAVVETVGKARSYGIMSVERCVLEMYGDTLSEEEKEVEIQRIKEQNGIIEAEEPKVIDDYNDLDNPEEVDIDG